LVSSSESKIKKKGNGNLFKIKPNMTRTSRILESGEVSGFKAGCNSVQSSSDKREKLRRPLSSTESRWSSFAVQRTW